MTRLLAVAAKDLRSEARAKEAAPAMILFGLVLVFLFTFALPPGAGKSPIPVPTAGAVGTREIAGAFLWAALLFSAIVGFGRTAAVEREANRIDVLVLAPVDPALIFAGKALANFIFIGLMELIVIPVFAVFFDVSPGLLFPKVLAVLIGTNIGLSVVGTLLGTASQYTRAKELVLPLLTFPVIMPLILSAIRLTSTLLVTGGFAGEGQWFILIAVFDVVFATIATVTYEYVIHE